MTLKTLSPDTIQRYGVSGPRYTSYPTAMQFHERFGADEYAWAVDHSNEDPVPKPLSLYVHIPFCHSLCYYCGCHKIITHNQKRVENYVADLDKEIRLRSLGFNAERELRQIHFGGGTPTYIALADIDRLLIQIRKSFKVSDEGSEIAIEIDPRKVDPARLDRLYSMGVNRMSFGVQDFDRTVQKAVNRLQDEDHTLALIDHAKNLGVSVSVDLIYGLPHQGMKSFMHTIDSILRVRPGRIALYHYAHMPLRIKAQRLIKGDDLPNTETKTALFCESIQRLEAAGYIHVGMDHFALPDDDLIQSAKQGALHRNFQGYSTHGDCDLIGIGVSAISKIGDSFSQNTKQTKFYHETLATDRFPIEKGYRLDSDDVIRADLIQNLMCRKGVNYAFFGAKHQIVMRQYFAAELIALLPLAKDGLIQLDPFGFTVTELGVVLLRNIAMVFDYHLSTADVGGQNRFSKVL